MSFLKKVVKTVTGGIESVVNPQKLVGNLVGNLEKSLKTVSGGLLNSQTLSIGAALLSGNPMAIASTIAKGKIAGKLGPLANLANLSDPRQLLNTAAGNLQNRLQNKLLNNPLGKIAGTAFPQIKGLLGSVGNGPGQVKVPVLATDTFNKTQIYSKSAQLLGDPRIPAPVYDIIQPTFRTRLSAESIQMAIGQVNQLTSEQNTQRANVDRIQTAILQNGKNVELFNSLNNAKNELQQVSNKLNAAKSSYVRLIKGG